MHKSEMVKSIYEQFTSGKGKGSIVADG